MASRLNYSYGQEYLEHDDGISKIISDLSLPKEKKNCFI